MSLLTALVATGGHGGLEARCDREPDGGDRERLPSLADAMRSLPGRLPRSPDELTQAAVTLHGERDRALIWALGCVTVQVHACSCAARA